MFLCIVWLVLSAPVVFAQDRGELPTQVDVAITGGYITGNIEQAQLQGRLHLSRSTKTSGFDLIGSAFRLWRPTQPGALEQVGDDLSLLALPFYYFSERAYVLGLGRLERIGLRRIENRLNGGMGVGIAPVRQRQKPCGLQVVSLKTQTLVTRYLSLGGHQAVLHVESPHVLGEQWMDKTEQIALSGFFVAMLMVNPAEFKDLRAQLDVGVDVKLTRAMSVRLAGNLVHESVVPMGLETTDFRSMLGLAWKTPRPGSGRSDTEIKLQDCCGFGECIAVSRWRVRRLGRRTAECLWGLECLHA